MQKLPVEFKNTPWNAPQVPRSVSLCLNSPVRVGTVMQAYYWLVTTPMWTYLFRVVQG